MKKSSASVWNSEPRAPSPAMNSSCWEIPAGSALFASNWTLTRRPTMRIDH